MIIMVGNGGIALFIVYFMPIYAYFYAILMHNMPDYYRGTHNDPPVPFFVQVRSCCCQPLCLSVRSHVLSVPKVTANLYCICSSIDFRYLKQMQYRFSVYLSRCSTDFRYILGHSIEFL